VQRQVSIEPLTAMFGARLRWAAQRCEMGDGNGGRRRQGAGKCHARLGARSQTSAGLGRGCSGIESADGLAIASPKWPRVDFSESSSGASGGVEDGGVSGGGDSGFGGLVEVD